ncbi:MAG: GNAT family N-acetyltransferase [Lachnospiraceae bacterium]|nr:GNAT family N-acetyltransferase [Lachnospiraceae bacterium]
MYQVIKNYRENNQLRQSFNELAEKTFGLNFEDWYQNGFWGENYNPYSIVQDGKVVANVSVNTTNILWNGEKKHFIQLGTVMTEEAYRNKGLIRRIMEEIEVDYKEKIDGMYLFANDEVLTFYPKFGFEKAVEFQYAKQVCNAGSSTMKQIPMHEKKAWTELETAINNNRFYGQFDMVDNSGLFLFYVTKFMQENVYYDKMLDTYVIGELEEGELFIHNVFSNNEVDLEDVIKAFGQEVKQVILGFTPKDKTGYTMKEVQEEDTTLFVKGAAFVGFEGEEVMFPTLAHA